MVGSSESSSLISASRAVELGKKSLASHIAAANSKQPIRCALQPCHPFEASCGADTNCVTDHCYEGKCALGPKCRPYGEVCYTYAPHTCCTGECKPVALENDCLRFLGLTSDITTHGGVNVDRQCENLGTCGAWPGMK